MQGLLISTKMNLNELLTLPNAQSFSEIDYAEDNYQFPSTEVDWSEVFIEETILAMMRTLDDDRQRIIFLLMAMGKDGYEFQHKDVARLMQIDYSWYMRIVRNVRNKLLPFLNQRNKVLSKKQEKLNKSEENSSES